VQLLWSADMRGQGRSCSAASAFLQAVLSAAVIRSHRLCLSFLHCAET
jgi:hypothetical protein